MTKKGAGVTCIAVIDATSVCEGVQNEACTKASSRFNFPLCLSRACLGKGSLFKTKGKCVTNEGRVSHLNLAEARPPGGLTRILVERLLLCREEAPATLIVRRMAIEQQQKLLDAVACQPSDGITYRRHIPFSTTFACVCPEPVLASDCVSSEKSAKKGRRPFPHL